MFNKLSSMFSIFGSTAEATHTASEGVMHAAGGNPLGTAAFIAIGIFVFCYALIALEHRSRIDKSGLALFAGSSMWIVVALFAKDRSGLSADILHESQEIFSIVVFLLAAMTIVETLLHYGLFDYVEQKISEKKLSATKLFWTLNILTFFLSAMLDNLTTTLIMVQVGRKIYRHKEAFLLFICSVIITANAGGAFSPLGDVTTIILWLAGKFSAVEVIKDGFLPSLAVFLIPTAMMTRKITSLGTHEEAEKSHRIAKKEQVKPNWTVIAVGLGSFTLPILMSILSLPPFIGLLFGLGILWMVTDYYNRQGDHHNSSAKIIGIIQKTDVATLKFFIGILLAVGALGHLGVLNELSGALFGETAEFSKIVSGSVILGALSAILDNVPLVAAALNVFPSGVDAAEWVLLAITAGTGGSMLVIGSAAGVAAMGQVPELTFVKYLRKATVPALLGFIAGVLVWFVQYEILHR